MERILKSILSGSFFIVLSIGVSCRTYSETNINAIRGAYLWYFANLIDWPSYSTFPNSQFVICAASKDKEDAKQISTLNKDVSGHPLKIRFFSNIPEQKQLSDCHVLFISNSMLSRKFILQAPKQTLLVTEGESDMKGQIHLFTLGKKLKFAIDNKVLIERGFRVNAKLLELARQPIK